MSRKIFFVAAGAFLFSCLLAAQTVSVRDEASVDVPRSVFGSEPSNEIKQEARRKAMDLAWKRYQAQNSSGARAALFDKNADEFKKLLTDLCAFSFYEEIFDKDAAKFTVKVRASCDQKKIDAAFAKLDATSAKSGSEKMLFTFVFMVRRASDSTNFIDKVTKTSSSTAATANTDQNSDSSNGNNKSSVSVSQDSASVTTTATTQKKGTIEKRDAVFKFRVEQSEGVDNAVTNVLTTAGFEVAKYSDVMGECPGVKMDELVVNFADPKPNQAESVDPDLRRRMITSARDCEQQFFAVGLVDILKSEELPDKTVRVTVALTADVRDIRKRVPTAVAAIAAEQFQSIGRDRIEAANSAIRMAAANGTREIVDMLRARGIR